MIITFMIRAAIQIGIHVPGPLTTTYKKTFILNTKRWVDGQNNPMITNGYPMSEMSTK